MKLGISIYTILTALFFLCNISDGSNKHIETLVK
jgi:hypothetical protein